MRGWVLFAMALVVLVLAPMPLVAAADPEAPGKVAGEAAKDMFSRALDLGIWTVVVFLLLVFILSRTGWKWMLEGLEKREAGIALAVEEARKAREEARALSGQIAAEKQKAADELRQVHDQVRHNLARMEAEMIAKGEAQVQSERERLYRDLAVAKDQALQQMMNQAADLAALISTKAIRRELNADDHRRLLDEALDDMRSAAAERRARTGTTA